MDFWYARMKDAACFSVSAGASPAQTYSRFIQRITSGLRSL
ncbi:MAG: hypothetical protein Q4C13_05460 [Clostridia bacterium]|nr:hypothetical protein [Clostridia bacterium]